MMGVRWCRYVLHRHTDTVQENTDIFQENTDIVQENIGIVKENTYMVQENTDIVQENTVMFYIIHQKVLANDSRQPWHSAAQVSKNVTLSYIQQIYDQH